MESNAGIIHFEIFVQLFQQLNLRDSCAILKYNVSQMYIQFDSILPSPSANSEQIKFWLGAIVLSYGL